MKHWSEYPSQQPAHRRRVRKARELRDREVAARLAEIRLAAARNCGLDSYPADLIRRSELATAAGSAGPTGT